MNTENFSALIEELDHLMWKTEKRKQNFLVFFMCWGGIMLFIFLSIGIGNLLQKNQVPIWAEYILIFLGLTVVPLLFIIFIMKIIERKSENLETFIKKTKSILYQYEYSNAITDDIESLLYQSKEIHETLLYVYKYYKKNKDSLGPTLYPFIKEFEKSSLQALYDIRKDLLYHTERKKEDLFRAEHLLDHQTMKSFAHVSEAQKIRLDAQIQDFEKLEKILVQM